MAGRGQHIAEAEVQRLKAHLEAVRIRLRLEDVDKTAMFRTEAELSQALAELAQAQNSLLTAREVLARNLDLSPGFAVLDPLDSESAPPAVPGESMDALIQTALDNRADLKSGELGGRDFPRQRPPGQKRLLAVCGGGSLLSGHGQGPHL